MKFILSYIIAIIALITFIQPAYSINQHKQIAKKNPPSTKELSKKVKHIPIKIITSPKDQKCLALNIYWEARNQDLNGQLAVGYVTINRVFSHKYPYTICQVVKQHKQFSWFSDGKGDIPKEQLAWANAKNVAEYILNFYSKDTDPTHGALFYHADYVKPVWRKNLIKTQIIGTHIFYKY